MARRSHSTMSDQIEDTNPHGSGRGAGSSRPRPRHGQAIHIRCDCGEVELRAHGAPMVSIICHCDDCQEGSARIESLPKARPIRDRFGGTHYLHFRTDRVEVVRGADRIRPCRLRGKTHTRRNIASCCNSALMADFDNWFPWLAVYAAAVADEIPPAEARVFTKFAPQPARLPDDVPGYSRYPLRFPVKVIVNGLAMWCGLPFSARGRR